jgi:hypothetical protein
MSIPRSPKQSNQGNKKRRPPFQLWYGRDQQTSHWRNPLCQITLITNSDLTPTPHCKLKCRTKSTDWNINLVGQRQQTKSISFPWRFKTRKKAKFALRFWNKLPSTPTSLFFGYFSVQQYPIPTTVLNVPTSFFKDYECCQRIWPILCAEVRCGGEIRLAYPGEGNSCFEDACVWWSRWL